MKTLLVTVSLALAAAGTAQAQIFRPSVGNTAVLGAVAGGLIGGHNGDRWAEGAVVGAVAGALIGAAITPEQTYSPPPVYQAPVNYGQRVYTSSGTTVVQAIPDAPVVAAAPTIVDQPAVQVVQTQPQVVYVEPTPRVVYVPAPGPRVVYAPAPIVSFGYGYGRGYGYSSGPRYPVYHRPSGHGGGYSHRR